LCLGVPRTLLAVDGTSVAQNDEKSVATTGYDVMRSCRSADQLDLRAQVSDLG
jgi:hypothetical protein